MAGETLGAAAPAASRSAEDTGLTKLKLQQARAQQQVPAAVLFGGIAALTGALLWALVTATTGYQIGWMGIGVGALVGVAVRWAGRGIDRLFRVIGAGWALAGCVFGNLLAGLIGLAPYEGIPVLGLLFRLTPAMAFEVLRTTFSAIDILFYFLAVQAGYVMAASQSPSDTPYPKGAASC